LTRGKTLRTTVEVLQANYILLIFGNIEHNPDLQRSKQEEIKQFKNYMFASIIKLEDGTF
jgi:hypothetical protein